jgi:hypothetical protein
VFDGARSMKRQRIWKGEEEETRRQRRRISL